ncbi:hypothetical protein F3Y22_tig00111330pilonHSYRG00568 [Hibiscus syriacus]|uniref:Uncharacterized protein n=1 Tax=Hibiscus syriacus TaxID=106335 RepID=A0A6A2YQ24_HIBSY|nr:hypothetical protein F3Y22_tig00111330pilonHSYRG00568 [Hibiscus syriacus]
MVSQQSDQSLRLRPLECKILILLPGSLPEEKDSRRFLMMENNMDCLDLYIGVTRRWNCSVGSDKPRLMTTLALYGVEGQCVGRIKKSSLSFFCEHNVDISPFLENIPGIPVAGIFCSGEIGCGYKSLTANGKGYPPPLSLPLPPSLRTGTPLALASSPALSSPPPYPSRRQPFASCSEPIRPHFVIASVGPGFEFNDVLQFMLENFGSRAPIILSSVRGILGRDALTHDFREVEWTDNSDEEVHVNTGIVLTVGFVPGLKVDVIPLLRKKTNMEIFALLPDYAMSTETIIVGDERGIRNIEFHFALSNVVSAIRPKHKAASVRVQDSYTITWLTARRGQHEILGGQQMLEDINALLKNIEFHFVLSNVVSAIRPKHKVASVRVQDSYTITWLTARRGQQEILGGQQMLEDINNAWSPPSKDFLKFNVDGAMKADGSAGGIRGVLGDNSGKMLLSFSVPMGWLLDSC